MSTFLLILKIIGIILLSVLAFFLALILIVLFVPVRYRIYAKKDVDSDWYAKANVSFLLHILSGSVIYDKNLNVIVRVFGIPIYNKNRRDANQRNISSDSDEDKGILENEEHDNKKSFKKISSKKNNKSDIVNEKVKEPDYVIDWNEPAGESKEDSDESISDQNEKSQETLIEEKPETVLYEENVSDSDFTEDNADNVGDFDSDSRIHRFLEKIIEKIYDVFLSVYNKVIELTEIIKGLASKSEEAAAKTADKINGVVNKIEKFQRFTDDYRNRRAVGSLLSHIKRLLKIILPKKVKGYIRFGMDDPATTGQILMILGMCAPFITPRLKINPVFSEVCLDGYIDLKGHISLISVLVVGCRILLNKDIRRLWKMYKNMSSEQK